MRSCRIAAFGCVDFWAPVKISCVLFRTMRVIPRIINQPCVIVFEQYFRNFSNNSLDTHAQSSYSRVVGRGGGGQQNRLKEYLSQNGYGRFYYGIVLKHCGAALRFASSMFQNNFHKTFRRHFVLRRRQTWKRIFVRSWIDYLSEAYSNWK